ncbi:MAG: hypothetical protein M0Q91_12140 [Methanoregula sp.]|jgi:hypothetical protein|nr:hypothetical protein [Methanoregula sp.]
MDYPNEIISPPRWWITFTPYGIHTWELTKYGYCKERMVHNMYCTYYRESVIYLEEWKRKYTLIQMIRALDKRINESNQRKELMER